MRRSVPKHLADAKVDHNHLQDEFAREKTRKDIYDAMKPNIDQYFTLLKVNAVYDD